MERPEDAQHKIDSHQQVFSFVARFLHRFRRTRHFNQEMPQVHLHEDVLKVVHEPAQTRQLGLQRLPPSQLERIGKCRLKARL